MLVYEYDSTSHCNNCHTDNQLVQSIQSEKGSIQSKRGIESKARNSTHARQVNIKVGDLLLPPELIAYIYHYHLHSLHALITSTCTHCLYRSPLSVIIASIFYHYLHSSPVPKTTTCTNYLYLKPALIARTFHYHLHSWLVCNTTTCTRGYY